MMQRILISGSSGFLGHHIKTECAKYDDIEILTPTSIELNLLSYDVLVDYLYYNKPDAILHMAAKCGGILANKNSPADFLNDNTLMGLNIYKAAEKCGVKRIYSLGSVCAYPKHCPAPFKEDDIYNGFPEETNAPYGNAKRILLLLSQTYRQQYNIGGAHFIPVNLYGSFDHDDPTNSHVIPALIKKFDDAIKTKAKTVKCWGTGSATREFLFAEDCAQVIVKAVREQFNNPLPINLGTGREISIKNLAQLVGKLSGFKGDIVFTGEVSDGQPRRLLDVSRAKELLHWTAQTKFEDGLMKTINWYKNK